MHAVFASYDEHVTMVAPIGLRVRPVSHLVAILLAEMMSFPDGFSEPYCKIRASPSANQINSLTTANHPLIWWTTRSTPTF
jgi:hypothetical protein